VIGHALAPVFPPAARLLAIRRRFPGADGVVLTFDDGPHPEGTPAVLEELARAGASAVFFVVGEQVRRRPELVQRILAEGHQVALHGDRHRLQSRLCGRTLRADLAAGLEAIERAAGARPRFHRPPYGIYSPAGLAAARDAGLAPLLWSRWGRDWRRHTTPEQIATRVLRAIGPGDVILLHDADFYSAPGSHVRTAAALALVLGQLRARKRATVLPVWQPV
jgi:peptidoglycan/xylan/chitin deacetylase (PgdA/CDA1 family)